jgi:hypothetical protein
MYTNEFTYTCMGKAFSEHFSTKSLSRQTLHNFECHDALQLAVSHTDSQIWQPSACNGFNNLVCVQQQYGTSCHRHTPRLGHARGTPNREGIGAIRGQPGLLIPTLRNKS